jgi:hypothetical protein
MNIANSGKSGVARDQARKFNHVCFGSETCDIETFHNVRLIDLPPSMPMAPPEIRKKLDGGGCYKKLLELFLVPAIGKCVLVCMWQSRILLVLLVLLLGPRTSPAQG